MKQIILHLFFVLRKSHLWWEGGGTGVGRGAGGRWLLRRLCLNDSQQMCTPKIQWNHLAYKDTFFYCNKNHLFFHLSTHTWNLKSISYKIGYQGQTKYFLNTLGQFNTNYIIIFLKCWNFQKLFLPNQKILWKKKKSEYLGIFHLLKWKFQN